MIYKLLRKSFFYIKFVKIGEDGGVSPRFALQCARFIHIHSFAQFNMHVRDKDI